MTLEERILGSLLGGAIGDAMGAATETRTPELIREKFGGYVREFRQAPEDTFARGAVAGYVTDDFSLAYYTAREIVKNGGKIDRGVAERSVLTWSEHPEYFDNYAGPTTRAGIARLKGETPAEGYSFLACDNAKATNGAGMKIGPVGMLHPGDLDRAVADAVTIIRVTHDNDLAISGGCAIAAAVSCAMVEGRNAVDIVNAGLYGAREGMRLARGFAKKLAGPSVEKRISLAAEIGLRHCGDYERAMLELATWSARACTSPRRCPACSGWSCPPTATRSRRSSRRSTSATTPTRWRRWRAISSGRSTARRPTTPIIMTRSRRPTISTCGRSHMRWRPAPPGIEEAEGWKRWMRRRRAR